jgi:hypothetical protein
VIRLHVEFQCILRWFIYSEDNLLPEFFDGVGKVLDRDIKLVDRTHSAIGSAVVILVPAAEVATFVCVDTVGGVPVVVARSPWHVCKTTYFRMAPGRKLMALHKDIISVIPQGLVDGWRATWWQSITEHVSLRVA